MSRRPSPAAKLLLILLLLSAPVLRIGQAHGEVEPPVTAGRLQSVSLQRPGGQIAGLAILLAPQSSAAEADALATALLDRQMAVLRPDFAAYRTQLDAHDGQCLYTVGELTDLAQAAQREMQQSDYSRPLLVGLGEGASFVRAALAHSPASTLAGGVAIDYRNALATRLPFCPGAEAQALPAGGFAYRGGKSLYNPLRLIGGDAAEIAALTAADPQVTAEAPGADIPAQAATAAAKLAAADAATMDALPLVEIPPQGPVRGIAIVYSGDGGWRDIDKRIGERLAQRGMAVVGVDALRYLWSERQPEEIAADLSRIVATYSARYDSDRVMLVGYSLGANVLPFAWPYLDAPTRDRLSTIALLAPERRTGFSVTVTGWMGAHTGDADVTAAIERLPAARTLCIGGREEKDSPCADPRLRATDDILLPGGHHFDGDYIALADLLLTRFLPPQRVGAR